MALKFVGHLLFLVEAAGVVRWPIFEAELRPGLYPVRALDFHARTLRTALDGVQVNDSGIPN
jgi:hypothetical protein